MTNSEALHIAEDILSSIADISQRLGEAHPRILSKFGELLDEVKASHAGITGPDTPLGIPWSLYDIRLLELIRRSYLPAKTGLEAKTDEQIMEGFNGQGNDPRKEQCATVWR